MFFNVTYLLTFNGGFPLPKDTDLIAVHQQAIKDFNIDYSAQYDERVLSIADRRFVDVPGAQYEDFMPGVYGEDCERIKIEVNKVARSLVRIKDEYTSNPISVDFISKDGANTEELAETIDMLMRSDEQDSAADEAYDNSFDESSAGGFGAYRFRAVYADEYDDENEHQRISIEPIYEADSCVYFDSAARREDKSDAKRCFVLIPISVDDYIEEYDDDPASWPTDLVDSEFDWAGPDVVYIAEYYKIEEVTETIHIYKAIDGTEEKYSDADFEEEDIEATLIASGSEKVREKKIRRRRVRKYKMSGSKVLEDCGYIAGRNIPIVPCYGKRKFISGIERFSGHVRLAKDVQRLANVLRSKLAEMAAMGSQEVPIFAAGQIQNHLKEWQESVFGYVSHLTIDPLEDKDGNVVAPGPIGHTKAPEIPPVMAALMAVVEQDIKDILGDSQGAEKIVSGVSGKAVELVTQQLDQQAYIYLTGNAKGRKRGGEIYLSMAKDLYIEPGRKMKTVSKQGKVGQIELNIPTIGEDGEETYLNDISHAHMGVAVTVSPSSSSQKAAIVKSITGMLQYVTDPQDQKAMTAVAMMNMEGEGLADMNDYFRQQAIRIGAAKPTKEEEGQMAQEAQTQPPDPNIPLIEAATRNEDSKAVKNQADTALTAAKIENTQADTDKKQAETMETLSDISREDAKTAQELLDSLNTDTALPQVGVGVETATAQPTLSEV